MTMLTKGAFVGAIVLALMGAAPALADSGSGSSGSGNDQDVIRTGGCSLNSDWKLKLSDEDSMLEVEFEVDQNVVGDVWQVTLKRNGTRFFSGQRTTQAPSGSFEVRRVLSDPEGTDLVVARAVNTTTGEVCRGRATSDF